MADACRVSGSDLPTASGEKEYSLKFPAWLKAHILATFFGSLALVAVHVICGIVFKQYWQFGMCTMYLFVGIQQSSQMYTTHPTKITRDADTWRVFSRSGKTSEWPTNAIESMETSRSCCDNWITITLTDAYVEDLKAKTRCCKGCIGKSTSFVFRDHESALQEFGFKASGQVYGQSGAA